MSALRVLSFDLDDTLWPIGPVIDAAERELWQWLQQAHPRVAAGHSIESMRALRASVAERFPSHAHDMTFLRRQALSEQFGAAGHDEAHADDALEIFIAARNRVECYADVRPALQRLRRSYRLYALSNGNADLGRCGLADLFDGHITAGAIGVAKPDPRIFAALLDLAGASAGEVLHIGDDPLADVVGAQRAGIDAVWLNREARPWPAGLAPPPRTLVSLEELR